jgi:cytochrome c556
MDRFNRFNPSLRASLAAGLLSLAAGVACAGQPPAVPYLEDTGRPAVHAVHGQRLQTIMRRLEALMFERQRTAVDIARERRTHLRETQAVAEELLASIPYIVPSAEDLSDEDRHVFEGLVTKLEAQVRGLAVLAGEGKADVIPRQFDAITTTCNACHTSFRELAGDVQP